MHKREYLLCRFLSCVWCRIGRMGVCKIPLQLRHVALTVVFTVNITSCAQRASGCQARVFSEPLDMLARPSLDSHPVGQTCLVSLAPSFWLVKTPTFCTVD